MSDDKMPELLPCPFCGSSKQPTVFGLKPDEWWVECSGYEGLCCKLFLSTTKEEAIRKWNTRTVSPAVLLDADAAATWALNALDDAMQGHRDHFVSAVKARHFHAYLSAIIQRYRATPPAASGALLDQALQDVTDQINWRPITNGFSDEFENGYTRGYEAGVINSRAAILHLQKQSNGAPAPTLCIDCHHNNLVGQYCAEIVESDRCLKCGHSGKLEKTLESEPWRCVECRCVCQFSRACGCRCVFGAPTQPETPLKSCAKCGKLFRYPPTDNKEHETMCVWCAPVTKSPAAPSVSVDNQDAARRVLWDWKGIESLSMQEVDELVKLIAAALSSTTSSISAAIAVVERLRDRANSVRCGNDSFLNGAVGAYNAVLTSLRALQPSTPTTSAIEAAKEINEYYNDLVGFNIRVMGAQEVAAIITKHMNNSNV